MKVFLGYIKYKLNQHNKKKLIRFFIHPNDPLWPLSLPHSGVARGVMVIITGYGHGDPSSIPGQD